MGKRYIEIPLATRIMIFFGLRSAKTWVGTFYEQLMYWKRGFYEIVADYAKGQNWLSMAPAILMALLLWVSKWIPMDSCRPFRLEIERDRADAGGEGGET